MQGPGGVRVGVMKWGSVPSLGGWDGGSRRLVWGGERGCGLLLRLTSWMDPRFLPNKRM